MKTKLLSLALLAMTTVSVAQARNCNVAADRKIQSNIGDYALNLLNLKGYTLVDNKTDAIFYMTRDKDSFGRTSITITHIASGMNKSTSPDRSKNKVLDSARYTMNSELAQATTIGQYEDIKTKWSTYNFVDVPELNAVEVAVSSLPNCLSFYEETSR